MKKNILIALLGLTMVLGTAMLIGCDDDGAPSCSSLCSKIKECPDADSNVDEQINECLEQCNDMKSVLQSGVFEEIANCAERTMCDDVDTEDVCFAPAMASCSPSESATTFLNTMCAKMVECEPEDMPDVASCLEMMTAMPVVYCLKTSVYEQTTACINNSTCDTAESCLEGLTMFQTSDSLEDDYRGE